MLAAFFVVVAYLGIAAIGSEAMDPPPKPLSAVRKAPPQQAALAAPSPAEALVARGADR